MSYVVFDGGLNIIISKYSIANKWMFNYNTFYLLEFFTDAFSGNLDLSTRNE